ncbi:GNAT family acetyltransferase [Megasphaera cerevisiae DSM 20462]|jgi:predicted GNAT family acetyltransferase|uniref:GNAT family acetyltransferase n=1 Tax=Megasphaera cerevisiae DSM 20462 TaxID=1122219 RepID=A0A0J6WWJ6_9FIRM|nr:GNAT family N-acetyltransferase [Megasphaera cerevisiae]KMO87900.1 GNAT family acetyltransferase [Megasphaera cerevisiae DSM 20462]MCI1750089.1 N-acetyltransferase [Megasphaera cerevisiae]OKY53663.1 GNAT family N-acetyltransferase [Megasphaera cerevisiae]SJZ43090.1 hypothetical protein SAMN05660900_00355 [Megasphaera cerevisiae DSM 20462]
MNFQYKEDKIWSTDASGKVVAEINFPAGEDGILTITHTFVDESLRGQHVAEELIRSAAEKIRQSGKKTHLTCSYAKAWFMRHPEEYKDILA